MKRLWTILNKSNLKYDVKNRIFIAVMTIISSILGGFVWLVLGRMIFPEISWLICFIGYPGIVKGFFGSILYIYNHEFS